MSLSTDLQAAISQLQTDHSSLVTAVRARNGVSPATNTAIASKLAGDVTIQAKADSLRAAVAAATTESLSLDFINDLYQTGSSGGGGLTKSSKFSDLITFTRASIATQTNRELRLERVAVNQPRFDCDPITGVLKGLLIEESRTNLLTKTESIQQWTMFGSSSSLSNVLSPAGTLNAVKLIGNTEVTWHQARSSTFSVTSGAAYTLSVYAKKGESDIIRLSIENGTMFPTNAGGVFNLTTGVVVSGASAKIVAIADGWYRCSITATSVASGSTIVALGSGASGTASDGVSGVIFWGAQLEGGAFATSYIPSNDNFVSRVGVASYTNSNGLLVMAPSGVARSSAYSYDTAGALKPIGPLFSESAATNMFTQSEDFTSANWNNQGPASTTPLVVTPASTDGPRGPNTMTLVRRSDLTARYLQRSITGAATGAVTFSVYVKANANSKFISMRLQAGAYENRADARINLSTGAVTVNFTGAVTFASAVAVNLNSGLWRVSFTGVSPTVAISNCYFAPMDRAAAIDSTALETSEIYVDAAQVEAGEVATSYIPTTVAQVTRAADVITSAQTVRSGEVAAVNTLAPWFNQSQSTLFVDFTPGEIGLGNTNIGLYMGSANLANDYAIIRRGPAAVNIYGLLGSSAGVAQASMIGSGVAASGSNVRGALAWKLNDAAFSVNGGAVQTDNSVILPVPTRMFIGNGSTQQYLNGTIRSVKYFPRRLTNAELQALTV